MRTPEIEAELNAAPILLQKYMPLFTRRGYRYDGMRIAASKDMADNAVFGFVNDKTGMQIRFAYYPPFKEHPRGFVLSILDRAGQRVYLVDYFKVHRRKDLEAWLDAEAKNPDFRIYWADYFKKLDELFGTLMKDIIEGRRWENIPFDFGDYK